MWGDVSQWEHILPFFALVPIWPLERMAQIIPILGIFLLFYTNLTLNMAANEEFSRGYDSEMVSSTQF